MRVCIRYKKMTGYYITFQFQLNITIENVKLTSINQMHTLSKLHLDENLTYEIALI